MRSQEQRYNHQMHPRRPVPILFLLDFNVCPMESITLRGTKHNLVDPPGVSLKLSSTPKDAHPRFVYKTALWLQPFYRIYKYKYER